MAELLRQQRREEEDEEEEDVERKEEKEEEDGNESRRLCDGFLDRLSGLMNKENADLILSEQDNMLETLEVANEKLSKLNSLSENSYELCAAEFRRYTQTLTGMKRDLDSVFRRIRLLKSRVASQYPEAYTEVQTALQAELEQKQSLEDEDDDR